MGFADGKILLDHENGTYYVGETVQGKVVFDLGKVNKFRGVYVLITGFCKVHWTSDHTRKVEGKNEKYTKTHESYEEYLNQKVYLFGGSQGEYSLNPGHYEYPFTCALPTKLPSSFEGSGGHIRYGIKASMDHAFKADEQLFMPLNIIAPYDLNNNRRAKKPLEMEIYKSYCCWCMNYGASEIVVKLPTSGFCVGQKIPIEVVCTNNSRVEINCLRFAVNRKTEYRATSEPDTKRDCHKVAEEGRGPVPAQSSRGWTVEMEAPYLTAYNLAACRFIDLQYEFEVTVEVPGCHRNTSESHRIYFGTAPISGPQPYPGSTNVSYSDIPTSYIPQYPGPNPQFPAISQYPQPGTNLPPPTNVSYPGAFYPYPVPNPAYPGGLHPAAYPASAPTS